MLDVAPETASRIELNISSPRVKSVTLLFSEKDLESGDVTPKSLRFNMFFGTPLYEELARKIGYDVDNRGGCVGTFYGVTARTPLYSRLRSVNSNREYYDPTRGERQAIDSNLVEGFRGDGLVVLPIPKDVVMNRLIRNKK